MAHEMIHPAISPQRNLAAVASVHLCASADLQEQVEVFLLGFLVEFGAHCRASF
jgi:hypothetical protein